jgi:hypothetical protein
MDGIRVGNAGVPLAAPRDRRYALAAAERHRCGLRPHERERIDWAPWASSPGPIRAPPPSGLKTLASTR